jgi:exopolysaccharide production protein ExoQ
MPANTIQAGRGYVPGQQCGAVAASAAMARPAAKHQPGGARLTWEYWVAGFFLFDTIGAFSFLDRFIYGEWDFKQGDKLSAGLNILVISAGLSLAWSGYRRTRRIGTGGWLLIALAGFLTLSGLWSIAPVLSARRGIQYLFWVLGVIGIAQSFDGDSFLRLFGRVCAVCAVLSIAVLAVSPNNALMFDGVLRGVFAHKSVLGQAMSTGVLLSLYSLRAGSKTKLREAAILALFLVMTIASRSMTSLLTASVFAAASCIIALAGRGAAGRLSAIVITVILVPAAILGAVYPDIVLGMLGKDPTLTGRSDLWIFVDQAIAQKPILGWGLMAFWSSDNPLALAISDALGWIVPQAHNGLLELLLSVGIVGTLFFAVLFARNAVIAVRCLRTSTREVAITLLLCCLGILLIGATESVLVDPAQPAANILFIAGLICERGLRARAGQSPRGSLGKRPAFGNRLPIPVATRAPSLTAPD